MKLLMLYHILPVFTELYYQAIMFYSKGIKKGKRNKVKPTVKRSVPVTSKTIAVKTKPAVPPAKKTNTKIDSARSGNKRADNDATTVDSARPADNNATKVDSERPADKRADNENTIVDSARPADAENMEVEETCKKKREGRRQKGQVM